MELVKGVVVCVYKDNGEHHRYCVLKRESNWEGWELVKGRVDDGESLEEAAKREVVEETGIEPLEVEQVDFDQEWEYTRDGKKYRSEYKSFVAKVPEDALVDTSQNPDEEHGQGFFLNFRDAKDILEHSNQKDFLKKVKNTVIDS